MPRNNASITSLALSILPVRIMCKANSNCWRSKSFMLCLHYSPADEFRDLRDDAVAECLEPVDPFRRVFTNPTSV